MKLMKSAAIVIILVGLGLIGTAFINSMLQLQIASALAGLGFICLGLLRLKRIQDKKQDEERYKQIMTRLDEIQAELKNIEQPKGTGVAIADVITSGLKYYAEQMNRQNREEQNG